MQKVMQMTEKGHAIRCIPRNLTANVTVQKVPPISRYRSNVSAKSLR